MRNRIVQVKSTFFDHLNRFTEHFILKTGTSHIQLFGSDQELVYLGRSGGKAHGDHTSGITGSLKQ